VGERGPLRTAALVEARRTQDVVVAGHDRDDVGLLIFPRIDSCRALAGLGKDADARAVLRSEPVRAFFRDMIQRLHVQGTGSSSRVVRALILAEPPSIDLGEMTDKGSINQRAVLAHRSADVERLYGDSPEVLRVAGAVPAGTGT
jgi:feruloyl-CoA synthase